MRPLQVFHVGNARPSPSWRPRFTYRLRFRFRGDDWRCWQRLRRWFRLALLALTRWLRIGRGSIRTGLFSMRPSGSNFARALGAQILPQRRLANRQAAFFEERGECPIAYAIAARLDERVFYFVE